MEEPGWWLRRLSAQVTLVPSMCRVPLASRKSRHRGPGNDGQGGVQVHVEGDAAGEGVEMEPADVGVQFVLHHHPLGVAGEQPGQVEATPCLARRSSKVA